MEIPSGRLSFSRSTFPVDKQVPINLQDTNVIKSSDALNTYFDGCPINLKAGYRISVYFFTYSQLYIFGENK